VLEAAAEVLVGAARRLHHAIERQVRVRNDFAHLKFLPDVEQSDAEARALDVVGDWGLPVRDHLPVR
jgi:hypothetical protein